MNRRDFLRRSALLAGGIGLTPQAIELIERLTPRKYVQGWTQSEQARLDALLSRMLADGLRAIRRDMAMRSLVQRDYIAHGPRLIQRLSGLVA